MDTKTRQAQRPSSPRIARAAAARPIQIVVTPGSGSGQAMARALELRDALTTRRYLSSLEVFPDLDSLDRWAKTEDGDFSLLICIGGDGTQSTTAQAAVRRQVPFLPVSSGFGNLFARAFRHPHTVKGTLDLLAHGRVIPCDVGIRNGELFLCQQSYGLIAEVQEAVESSVTMPRARWQRWLSYYRAATRYLRDAPPPRQRVVVDDRLVAVDAALIVVANVKTYGAWLPLTPDASPVDGLFDVFVMKGATHRQVFAKLLWRHLRLPRRGPGTVVCRGKRVSVSGPRSTRDQLEVLPGRLPVVVSRETVAALSRDLASRPTQASLDSCRVA
jgi:diacylglycerol kinase (ATP)